MHIIRHEYRAIDLPAMWLQLVSTNTRAAKVLCQQKMSQSILESPKDEAVRATKEGKETMTTAAIYCRVSTDNQEAEGTSLQTQLDALPQILPG